MNVLIQWKHLMTRENTWEQFDIIKEQFPSLELEDKSNTTTNTSAQNGKVDESSTTTSKSTQQGNITTSKSTQHDNTCNIKREALGREEFGSIKRVGVSPWGSWYPFTSFVFFLIFLFCCFYFSSCVRD